ncbi:MAG: STAS domain-containing protein [Sumerlaeia bacterium]
MEKLILLNWPGDEQLSDLLLQIRAFKDEGVQTLLLDVSHLKALGPMAVGQLARLYLRCQKFGISCKVKGLTPEMRRVLHMAGLSGLVEKALSTGPLLEDFLRKPVPQNG